MSCNLKTLVVASAASSISELTSGAAMFGGPVTLAYAGDRDAAVNADKAYYFGELSERASFVSCIPDLVKLALAENPDVILLDCSANGRLAAAMLAAAFGTSAQADVSELELADDRALTKRMVYGGSAFDTELSGKTAVLCIAAGVFTASEPVPVPQAIDAERSGDERIRFVEKRTKSVSGTDLSGAKRVLGVGRGLSEESDLELCRAFAERIDAEIGCTRPVAEEKKWLPKERYIGVSGAMIKPDFYFAVGISGQVQHVVGVNKAGTIIAVDKNEAAPIFKFCDYGIVGDLRKILPILGELATR